MSLLTGHKYKRIWFATTAKRRQTEETKVLPILRKNLIAALADHRLMTASVTPPILNPPTNTVMPTTHPALTADMLPKIPPDINTSHCYAVLDYDPKTDMLEIWNPHGQTFNPKGTPGLANGYVTQHGRFHIPLADAYSFFTSFYFETADPATMPATSPVGTR